MRMPRTSIAGLMGAVLVASLGLTALRSGSAVWAGTTFLVTCGVLALAVVGAVCRIGAARAWWLGFALFGGGYMALVSWDSISLANWNLPTVPLLNALLPPPLVPGGMMGIGGFFASGPVNGSAQTGHCLIALLFATLGGLLALGLFGASASRVDRPATETKREFAPPRRWWRRPAVVVSAVLLLVGGVALMGLGRAPAYPAAVTFLATWGLLVLAVVGAILGPRGRRAAWLGVALVGIGYLGLIFRHADQPNWARVATDRLLHAVRLQFPWIPDPGGVTASNARIMKVLDRPIPMRYPNETPLEDVIKDIHASTHGPDEPRIGIYVDPLGLQEVEKTMQSTITIDLDDVPLRTSLHLLLRQLGLTYQVGGGVLTITSAESEERIDSPPVHQDPFLVVGHCLLALVAAGLGGMLAPWVCRMHL